MADSKRTIAWIFAMLASTALATIAQAGEDAPSRPLIDKCVWEKLADKAVGLAAWVQRCDFGFRQIHFEFAGNALAVK